MAGLVLAAPAPAIAADAKLAIALNPGRLAETLQALSVRSRTGLLFSPDVVGDRRNARVAGTMTLEDALDQLLAGAGLAYRRASANSYIIYALPTSQPPQPISLPEILVVGRRTQNADIRRTENDIQPYQVFAAGELESSQSDNVDRFLRSRLTSNATLLGPTQDPAAQFGNNRSETNLHGLGPSQTLILVDGGRMPSVPELGALEMRQPDITGVPLLAIDRIETLTSTAGGIYGPGATGGVINLILRRDYRGADVALTSGLSSRGDGFRIRVDGRIGFTPDRGHTDVMLSFSRAETDALPLGRRDYAVRARRLEIARDPAAFIATFPTGDGLLVRSISGAPLTLSPRLGGGSLGAAFTYLPTDGAGVGAEIATAALANAGQIPSALAPDGGGAGRSLMSETEVTSVLVNVRRRFGDRVDAFVDLLGFQNDGRAQAGSLLPNSMVVSDFEATNPFGETVVVTYPTGGFDNVARTRVRTYRLSLGAIVRLPFDWKADATYALGAARTESGSKGYLLDQTGTFTDGSAKPLLDPFGDWRAFSAALNAYVLPVSVGFATRGRFRDASLRLAGPLFSTPAGLVGLTLLAEQRTEEVRSYTQRTSYGALDFVTVGPGFAQRVSSLYGEVRVPIVERSDGPWPLRGLELQLAARYDGNRTRVPDGDARLTARQSATAYTAGMKTYPHERLMLRASLSTGILPPQPAQFVPATSVIATAFGGADPKRGGREVGSEGRYTLSSLGSLDLEPERATALSLGMVFNPDGGAWPRVSLDYTRIEKTNEIIVNFGGRVAYFLANEARFPDRVTRAPLTEADRAAGFTGGVITAVDASFVNVGRTWSDAIDLKADYGVDLDALGRLDLYGAATWQPRLTRRVSPDRPKLGYEGFAEGPLRWRANIGGAWTRGPVSIQAHGQYYGGYRAIAFPATVLPSELDPAVLDRPGVRISPQFYLDLSTSYRLDLPKSPIKAIDVRLGVQNVLDQRPPTVTNTDLGFSYYGDPRRRRFELSLRGRF